MLDLRNPKATASFAVAPIPFDAAREPDLSFILDCVSYHTRIPKECILGRYGTPPVVSARSKAFWLCRELTTQTYYAISAAFGRDTHDAFYHAVIRANEKRSANPTFKAETDALKSAVEEAWIREGVMTGVSKAIMAEVYEKLPVEISLTMKEAYAIVGQWAPITVRRALRQLAEEGSIERKGDAMHALYRRPE